MWSPFYAHFPERGCPPNWVKSSLVYDWCRQADVDDGKGPPGALTTAEKEELSHLRREVKVLRMEREILKRAATFFAKESA
jgi:transposase